MRVAVDLACGRLKDRRAQSLGKTKHVDRAVDRSLGRLDGIVLVVDRRGRAREVVDLIDLDIERKGHVVADELEAGMIKQVLDVALGACEEVVDAKHFVAMLEQRFAQMRSDEARAASDKDALAEIVLTHSIPRVRSQEPAGRLCVVSSPPKRRHTAARCAGAVERATDTD